MQDIIYSPELRLEQDKYLESIKDKFVDSDENKLE